MAKPLKLDSTYKLGNFFGVIVILWALLGVIFFASSWQSGMESFGQKANSIGEISKAYFSDKIIKLANSAYDPNSTFANETNYELKELVKLNQDIHMVYIYIKKGNQLYCVAASEPGSLFKPLFADNESALIKAQYNAPLQNGKTLITNPVQKNQQSYVSLLMPVQYSKKTVAVIAIDYPIKIWREEAVRNVTKAAFMFLALFLIIVIIYIILNKNILLKQEVKERKETEKALQDSKENLDVTLNAIGDAVIVTDTHGVIVRMNPAAEKLSGYLFMEAKGKPIEDVCQVRDSKNQNPFCGLIDKVIKFANAFDFSNECTLIANDNNKYQIAYTASIIRKADNSVTGMIVVFADVTQDYELQKIILENEQKFHSLFSSINDGICLHEIIYRDGKPADYCLLEINQKFEIITGLKTRDVIGKTGAQVFQRQEPPNLAIYAKVVETGEAVSFETFFEPLNKYLSISVFSPGKGLFATVFQDITERKQAEIDLTESERMKTLLLANLQGMAYRCNYDNDWTMQFVSRGCYELTGYKPESLLNNRELSFNKLIEPGFHKVVWQLWQEAVITKAHFKFEYPIITANGKTKWVLEQGQAIYQEDGTVEALEGLIIDITDRKTKEEEIKYLLYHDQLTGLYNRIFFEEEMLRLDNKGNLPLTLVMLDANGLKLTNDAFGHQTGDLLLKKLASILQTSCSKGQTAARIGGDEFVILLPKTDAKKAAKFIDRIHDLLQREKMDNGLLSVSVGFAVKKDLALHNNELFKQAEDDMYRHKLSESSSMRSRTIDLIINSLYEKSNREMLHSNRVGNLCLDIATKMNFDNDYINQIRLAGLMHDIGKIGINDIILNKVEKLSSEERNELKRHSEIGYRILSSANEFSEIAEYVLAHHERWDGLGYPKGLQGEEIPLEARIIAVADSYDAMVSNRPYRKALSEKQAVKEIQKNAGTQFDPAIVTVFLRDVLQKTS